MTRSRIRYGWLTAGIIVLAAGLYLVGSGRVSLWDRDEAWYAQTSRQMLESGNWVVPHFLDNVRSAKPVFIYWCQATAMHFFGANEFSARLPSALGMTATLILLGVVLGRKAGGRRAMLTVLIFATSAMVITSAKMCLIDATMLFFITGAQLCLFKLFYDNASRRPLSWYAPGEKTNPSSPPRQWPTVLLLWICLGMATLAKGPFALAVLFMSMVILAAMDVGVMWKRPGVWRRALRWWKSIHIGIGIGIVLLIVLPWLVTAWFRDPAFFDNLLLQPFLHAGGDAAGHAAPPGYYVVTIWVMYFPWSLLLPTALVLAWKYRKLPHVRFAFATIVGNWIFVEIMETKLPHYLLPSYAALAFLTADALIRNLRGREIDFLKKGFVVGAAGWLAGSFVLAAVPWAAMLQFPRMVPKAAAAAFTGVGVVWAIVVFILWLRRRTMAAAMTMGLGMMAVIAILFAFYLPNAPYLRIPELAGARLRELNAVEKGQVIMTDFHEPSLAFYQGGTIRERYKTYLRTTPSQQWPQWIVMTRDRYNKYKNGLKPGADPPPLEEVASFRGYNYAGGGKVVDVLVLKKTETAMTHTPRAAVRAGVTATDARR